MDPAELSGMTIHKMTPAAFDAARADLAALLLDAVAHGASVGFLDALTEHEAHAYWDEVGAALSAGARLLFVAERDGALAGTVQLDLCQRPNGRNRAEVQKLLVHSGARRGGIATALMRALEDEARRLKRGLLFLDTEAGAGAEQLYRALGFSYLGGLPDYACSTGGELRANAIYFKLLAAPGAGA